ncbi:hypothetical protein COL26_33950 [Bacillus thuringiensis]|uniref:Bacterial Ig domain-containing protein n=1 Tax=Bacillus thuringiensis TaxID=1428 RepID=A0ABD6S0J9_BACTU|nr:hypothetical protein [Bacillus thuringiensis]PER36572.1 hypothetical protein CN495_35315 [Bacillus thuringiensis]PEU69974.1 hypothetical protein CN411_33630 [Bacillus thuringiensis]PFI00318.1 hypothetical protein COI79_32030 [Bacillus thuringiensis]PFW18126.1 hypothetical protein COL26_33950 [Bacillus thuringiensis]PGY79232.1 hypothetical protein COE44_12220 [Bacillus thuringiensis]
MKTSDGNIYEGTADEEGEFSIPIYSQQIGNALEVIQTVNGETGTPRMVTVEETGFDSNNQEVVKKTVQVK